MPGNKRKSPRRPLSMKAYLYTQDGWPLCECKLRDVSETGAQLTILPSDDLPDNFLLSLSRDGKVRRHCELIWRDGARVGAHFRGEKIG